MTSSRHILSVLLLIVGLSLSALPSCNHKEEVESPDGKVNLLADSISAATDKIVFVTDSDEWHCRVFKEGVRLSEMKTYTLPDPWRLPTRAEARILRGYEYTTNAGERFFTDDGYTFQMPSSSVTKAGSKKTYTIVGLWRRRTVIEFTF